MAEEADTGRAIAETRARIDTTKELTKLSKQEIAEGRGAVQSTAQRVAESQELLEVPEERRRSFSKLPGPR